ncbi:TetR family transcriptional regulator [Kribbella turkmenica]|uniref:TetR family transcriptional regulator n=1 Tax=Kribbella turkmenica TaxID=2530375 RepID=A0A4R4XBA8_9ACTN|nr:TetR family transcriptional regulator [Kribbella turkmenica]TDD27834.1 TetR family transcriptional regulator [Kribbella turkmenica]
MARAVNPTARKYRSTVRTEQAQLTRRRILDAAHRLFVANGYAGTTVNAVAAEAGVVAETIYSTLGGKRGLLEGVIDATIVAYLAPLHDPDHDRSSRWAEIDRLDGARERLRVWAEFVCQILAHTSPVHALIRGAADSEPFAVKLRERLLRERLADIAMSIERYVSDALRPGLTVNQASERACALASPEMHHLLTVELGWTARQHQEWLCDLLEVELLGPE